MDYALNGTTFLTDLLMGPTDVQEQARPVIGRAASGMPIVQGYETHTWVFEILNPVKMAALINFYESVKSYPVVLMQSRDPHSTTGDFRYYFGWLEPISRPKAFTNYYNSVTLTFQKVDPSVVPVPANFVDSWVPGNAITPGIYAQYFY